MEIAPLKHVSTGQSKWLS